MLIDFKVFSFLFFFCLFFFTVGIEKCKDPGIPRNGARRGDQFFHKARVVFLCNKGFTLDGNNSITCQEGEWSSNLPYCRGTKGQLSSNDTVYVISFMWR